MSTPLLPSPRLHPPAIEFDKSICHRSKARAFRRVSSAEIDSISPRSISPARRFASSSQVLASSSSDGSSRLNSSSRARSARSSDGRSRAASRRVLDFMASSTTLVRMFQTVSPYRRVHENQFRISLFLRGMYSRSGMLPPARIRLRAASARASFRDSLATCSSSLWRLLLRSNPSRNEAPPASLRSVRSDLGQPDERLGRFDLTEEGPEFAEAVMPPALEQAGGLRGHSPSARLRLRAPVIDLAADAVDVLGVPFVLLTPVRGRGRSLSLRLGKWTASPAGSSSTPASRRERSAWICALPDAGAHGHAARPLRLRNQGVVDVHLNALARKGWPKIHPNGAPRIPD